MKFGWLNTKALVKEKDQTKTKECQIEKDLGSIGKWVHKDVNASKILFNSFNNFLQAIISTMP